LKSGSKTNGPLRKLFIQEERKFELGWSGRLSLIALERSRLSYNRRTATQHKTPASESLAGEISDESIAHATNTYFYTDVACSG
jgi:hypothetical protein